MRKRLSESLLERYVWSEMTGDYWNKVRKMISESSTEPIELWGDAVCADIDPVSETIRVFDDVGGVDEETVPLHRFLELCEQRFGKA